MPILDKHTFANVGESLFLLAFILLFLSVFIGNPIQSNSVSMVAVILMLFCIVMVYLGGGTIHNPSVGFLVPRLLDEREKSAAARATQVSTYALLSYVFIFSWLIPDSVDMHQALFGAFHLVVAVSGISYHALLNFSSGN